MEQLDLFKDSHEDLLSETDIDIMTKQMQACINKYSKVYFNIIYGMASQNKDVYKELDNFISISHNTLDLITFLSPSLESKYNHLQYLFRLSEYLHSNFDYLTNINGYFIILNNNKPPEYIRTYNTKVRNLITTYIYLIQDSRGLIKIGRSNNPNRRFNSFKVSNPGIKILNYYPVLTIDNAESEIHKRFKKERVYREWFSTSYKILDEYISDRYCLNSLHNQLNYAD